MKQILINCEELQTRVAVVENGRLRDFFIERRDEERLVGSIFQGKIRNLEASLQAAFVDVGAEKNAFLHYWDMLPATQEMLEEGNSQRPQQRQRQRRQPEVEPVKETLIGRIRSRFFGKAEEEAPPPPPQRQRRRRKPARKKNNFTVEDIPDLFKVNSEVLVQVTKGPIGTKGARVTTNLSIPGRYLVLLPNSSHIGVSKRVEDHEERSRLRQILRDLDIPSGMGVICSTVGAGKKEEFFQRDLDMLLDAWELLEDNLKNKRAPCCVYQEPDLVERALRDVMTEDVDEVVSDSKDVCELAQTKLQKLSRRERVKIKYHRDAVPIFQRYRLTQQIENVFGRRVPLPSGGYICIDETEALIAIDVNSGKNRKGKDHPETIKQTNLEAVDEIARQLRLRNLGGLIVLDLIDMRAKPDQREVYTTLKKALLEDRARTKTYAISPLGLVEMTRQREHESLLDAIYSPCPYCEGKGMVKSATSMSVEIQRRLQHILRQRRKPEHVRVMVHPSILERLRNEDADLLMSMESEFGGELSFRGEASLHMEEFKLVDQGRGKEL